MEARLSSLVQRMIRAARLDNELYEEVERNEAATRDALYVVLIVAVATGIGAALGRAIAGQPAGIVGALVGGIIGDLFSWVVWAGVTLLIGTRLFQGTATYGELLRTIGFAVSPRVLNIFSFIPVLGGLIVLITAIWALVAGVVAVRQALDFDTGKAIITTVLGWLVLLVVSIVLGVLGFAAGALL